MAHVSPFEFARAVQSACDRSDLVAGYDVQILDDTVVKVQAILTYDAFIDVFYNADTGKCSYALIEKAARVFGADNAFIGWHIHPFDDPSQHVPSSEISFLDFLRKVEEHAAQRQR
jgi:hypothetical protein